MQKPRRLRPGDCIGVAAPSGPVDPDSLSAGVRRLESWGLRVLVGDAVLERNGYLAGSDTARAADLNALWANPAVSGILCARGGYGAMRILPDLDWDLFRSRPLFFCGFSDITVLHVTLRQRAGLVTFHGPMPAAFGSAEAYNSAGLRAALFGQGAPGLIPWPAGPAPEAALKTESSAEGFPRAHTVQGGVAEGVLLGGNLTLLCALMGTPYEPDLAGTLLMLEDVDEAPYRIDRMLTQLLLAGKLNQVRGVLFGDSPTCMNAPPGRPSFDLLQVLLDRLGPLGIPIHYGFPCGHTRFRATLPLGVMARLDASTGQLEILESPLSVP